MHLDSKKSQTDYLVHWRCRWSRVLLLLASWITLPSCAEKSADQHPGPTLTFGQRQVDQMIADRPDMANVLPPDDPILLWVVAGFNGERTGLRVYWNAMSTKSGQPAEHWPAYFSYPPQICVSGGSETTPIDRWTGLIYEFFNMENDPSFEVLGNRAQAGEIDGDAYATGCAKLEFAALKRLEKFIRQHPLPPSAHGNDPYYRWVKSSPASVEEYFTILEKSGGYNPIKFYRSYYDESLAPSIDSKPNAATGDAAAATAPETANSGK